MLRHVLHQVLPVDQLRAHIAVEDAVAVPVAQVRLQQRFVVEQSVCTGR